VPRLAKVPTPPPAGYLWTPEAARRMGVSVKTLWNYRHLGKGPKPKVRGRKLAYRIDEIDAWLNEQDAAEDAAKEQAAHDARPPEPRTTRRPARAAA
jgi:predicted DNA-binding transcriptional regulator AlpA